MSRFIQYKFQTATCYFSVDLGETLFAGYFNPLLNTTLPRRYESCTCGGVRRAGNNGLSSCRPKIGCFEASNAKRHLMTTLRLGKSRDFKPFTNLVLETAAVELGDDGAIKARARRSSLSLLHSDLTW